MSINNSLYSTEAFQSFFRISTQSLVLKANLPHFTILAVSDACLDLVHKKREELLGKNLFEVFPGSGADPSEQNSVFSSFRRVIKTGQPDELPVFKYEIFIPETGQYEIHHWTNVNAPIFEDGKVAYIINTTTNITEQVRQQERELSLNHKLRLLNSELEQRVNIRTKELANAIERLNVALDAGNFGTTEVDLITGNMVCNERFKNLFGRFNGEQMTYPDMFAAMLPEYRESVRARSKKAQAEHSLYEATYEIAWPDGSIHWIEAHGRARYDKEGNPDRMVGILADVTEQVNARIQLEQTEGNLRMATEAAALGTWYINTETLEFYPSNRLKELFGYYPDEVMPYEVAVNQIVESHRNRVTEAVEASIQQGKMYEVEHPIIGFHDGKLRWVRATGRLYPSKSGEPAHFSGVMVDITKQVTALKALQQSEEKLKIAIETGKMGAWSIETTTLKTTLSDFVRDMLGILPDQEPTMDLIMSAIKPQYHKMLMKTLKNAIENGIPSDSEYAIVNLQTGEEKWVKATATVLFDSEGKPAEYTGIFMDITERKLDELRKNDFIGMVSHELKTPLTSLTAIVQVANLKLKSSEDTFLAGAMDKAGIQVKRMSNMINGFLNVSRLESAKLVIDKHQFNLEELIEETIKETEITVSSHNFNFAACRPVIVDADQDKIGSVLTNLISNAVKYSPKGKEIDIKCEVIGDRVQVSVKDEGMGLKPRDQDKVFERYYRVETYHTQHISGFGIGLYLSAEIIHRHNGEIWVDSESGKGSTFFFSLPLSI